jgi:hypothetical protein
MAMHLHLHIPSNTPGRPWSATWRLTRPLLRSSSLTRSEVGTFQEYVIYVLELLFARHPQTPSKGSRCSSSIPRYLLVIIFMGAPGRAHGRHQVCGTTIAKLVAFVFVQDYVCPNT